MTKILLACLALGSLATATEPTNTATEPTNMNSTLTDQQRHLAAISASAARGDIDALRPAIHRALDAGAGVNDIKEILVQLYAYCGFPRSLNALAALMDAAQCRAAAGKHDAPGAEPGPRPAGNALDYGAANQTKLVGAPVQGPLYAFAPAIDEYLKAHLFGDIFSRDNVDWQTRETATIAALAAMEGTQSQLAAHIRIGKHNGLTDAQVNEILALAQKHDPATGVPVNQPFAIGAANTAYAQYFTGRSWLARLTSNAELNAPVANVTFEPSCRNNWHSHTGGQLLIAVGGIGYYQEKGQPARRLQPGDVVEIGPDVIHWHGAAPDSWFSHLAIECNPATNKNTWLAPVTDEEYAAATAPQPQNK